MKIKTKVKKWGKTGLYVGLSTKQFELGQEVIVTDELESKEESKPGCLYNPIEIRKIFKEVLEEFRSY